ncbi:hypothetical protein AU255_10635 [Methyloprofundus sedimenti]|uniref:Integrase SAM-like N-terminal domain-containing protein n=1 Tax=Methyloprofundus sedimenti TaxID=1420851 RepID=A0A1V8M9R4_9GAMM|nr:phage integrase N-terminal SAM-like domain-containing protein [Methyloprofundus sedimenti]OQK18258.1 hypothetical protein AU255_10635 [Methyloprofundus sedimenti]
MSTTTPEKILLEKTRDTMQRLHYSIHTERTYCDRITQYILFHYLQVRAVLLIEPEKKVEVFLTYLAVQDKVAAFTQNWVFNTLIFLYKRILEYSNNLYACVIAREKAL